MKKNVFYSIGVSILALITTTNLQAQVIAQPTFKFIKPPPSGIQKPSSKISPDLNFLYSKHLPETNKANPDAKAIPSIGGGLQKSIQIAGDRVLLDVTIKEDNSTAKAALEKIGFKTFASYGRIVSGSLPIDAISKLEAINEIRFVRPAYKPHRQFQPSTSLLEQATSGNSVKPVISQGDTAQRSYIARNKYKVNGSGVKVGILSDSYDNLGTAGTGVKNGELPGPDNPQGFKTPVKVLEDDPYGDGADEGRGMAEIVHDVAPGAAIAFHTADLGQGDFAQGIVDLANSGCKVITDDAFYYAEPYFQDGIIAQAVDYVKKNGVTYFSAAGNESRQSYESVFRGSNYSPFEKIIGTAHNFGAPGDHPAYFLPITIPQGGYPLFDLQWDDPFFSQGGSGAASDLDIYLLDSYGQIVAYSNENNIESGDPIELFDYFNPYSSDLFYIVITKYSGPDPSHLKFLYYGDVSFVATEPAIPGLRAGTVIGHAKAEGAIATGAAFYYETPAFNSDTPRIESFSSLGGTPNYIDDAGNRVYSRLKKPEITAPDGGNTSFFPPAIYFGNQDIPQDADNYPNFFGTSAAAPHAAGVAALMIDAQKMNTITPDQIKGILSATAIDMNNIYTPGFDKGFDYNTGAGFIQADAAVGAVKYPSVYVKDLSLQPVCADNPEKTRNWKILNPNPFDVQAHWVLTGTDAVQEGYITVPPGEKTFSTKTAYYLNQQVPNMVILDWKNNLNTSRINVAYSTSAKCGQDIISESNSDERLSVVAGDKTIGKPNIAGVYPNPATTDFKVYLSLNSPVNADLSLYSIDGKLLYQRSGQPNGIVDIDASGYRPGLYILKVRQGNFYKTFKVIKQ